ncbi:MAG: AAA family ATPase [Oscillospiraceae bacterium]
MLIKTLRMENFRQFRGTTKVDFSCDPNKNVTIILGDNTFGKTTLLQAFNWCFYGKVNFDQRPDFLLNYELSEEMRNGEQQIVEVEITVLHDGTEYIITRKSKGITVQTGMFAAKVSQPSRFPISRKMVRPSRLRRLRLIMSSITFCLEDLSTYFSIQSASAALVVEEMSALLRGCWLINHG